eukprot:6459676-Amphidinium_carterae.1
MLGGCLELTHYLACSQFGAVREITAACNLPKSPVAMPAICITKSTPQTRIKLVAHHRHHQQQDATGSVMSIIGVSLRFCYCPGKK